MSCLYIFIRDLRISDNLTYMKASNLSSNLVKVFFLNKEQIKSKTSSNSAVDFFTNHLKTFSKENNISIINTKNLNDQIKNIEKLHKKHQFKYIAFHYDYTPYALLRQKLIGSFCNKNNITLINTHDQLLLSKFHLKSDNTNYFKFTPYLKSYPFNSVKHVKQANINYDFKNYSENRNNLEKQTTRLSVYLKFGIISPRQVFFLFKQNQTLVQQLIWRDFYYTYYYFNQNAFNQGDNTRINSKYESWWKNDPVWFKKWCNGTTGIPIVDAGMRQLNTEHFMHNRVRMIVATTLSKLMRIDWRLGEKYFSQKLIDIDRIQNLAGWQSVVGISKHSLPYFRVFNPWIQAKKYDPNCVYIKKYIPELRNVENKDIHNWSESYKKYPKTYIKPIFNFETQKQNYLKIFN